MYDMPYRLEQDGSSADGRIRWVIQRTGEGKVCEGYNFTDMRRLVDAANEQTSEVKALREALGEMIDADDAMSAFVIAADRLSLDDAEWKREHAERHERRLTALTASRATLGRSKE